MSVATVSPSVNASVPTTSPVGPASVMVDTLTVPASTCSEKTTRTFDARKIPCAPVSGVTDTTVGGSSSSTRSPRFVSLTRMPDRRTTPAPSGSVAESVQFSSGTAEKRNVPSGADSRK